MTALADTSTRSTPASSRRPCGSHRPCSTVCSSRSDAVHPADRLAATSSGLAEPQWPLDPSAAASAGQDALYTSWLRDGQDQASSVSVSVRPSSPDRRSSSTSRSARKAPPCARPRCRPDGHDTRDLRPPRRHRSGVQRLPGRAGPADLPNDTVFDIAVVDHTISDLLAHPLATAEQTRIYAVAQLLALRQGLEISGANLQRHSVVIGTAGSRRARCRVARIDHRVDRRDPGLAGDARRRSPANRPAAHRRRGATGHAAVDRRCRTGAAGLPTGGAEQRHRRVALDAARGRRARRATGTTCRACCRPRRSPTPTPRR